MSSGQRPRTREHFPRMNDRAGRRRHRRLVKKYAAFVPRVMLGVTFEEASAALLAIGQAGIVAASMFHGLARAAEQESEKAREAWWNQGRMHDRA